MNRIDTYKYYRDEVSNRVALSIGCEPSDIDRIFIMDCFLKKIPARQAAKHAEHNLMRWSK